MCAKNIKHLKPRVGKKSFYKQGYFNVQRSTKYSKNTSEPCIYRSSLEFKFMKWCEWSNIVVQWKSEPFSVQYICLETGRSRNYWLDFSIVTKDDEFWLIEVKPIKEVDEAKQFGSLYNSLENEVDKKRLVHSRKIAAKNWSKWQHAKRIANEKGWKFKLVTENFLKRYT